MDALSAVFRIVALVIAVGGVAKLVAPGAFAGTLRALGLPGGTAAARSSGAIELVVGIWAVIVGGRVAAALVAAAYAAFTVVVLRARQAGAPSCGCFGATAAPPSVVHVAVNATSSAVAAAAVIWPPAPLSEVLVGQPLAGVPYLVALGLGVCLTVVLDTTGAELVEETTAVHRLGPTFRDNRVAGTTHSHRVPPTPASGSTEA